VSVPPADKTSSPDDTPRPDDGATHSGPRLARTGATLGRYLLDEVLGQGAMATVFRARDGRLGRTVAIKVMNLAVAARTDAGERFRREAQAVAALRHPGIVEIYDFAAATADEPAYIVAELIAGPTLSELLASRRGRLLPEVAALIGSQVADALAAAHERGIVHRDIKPDNVMLEKTAAASRVVITDFGVAHVTGMETMTATGALVGSPAYMSPEQARGQDAGWASDIWATGVMLYQMVTGALPFPGREPFVVMAAIGRGDFRRPSRVQATVPPELEQIIVRCLAAESARRATSARALGEELRALARQAGLDDGPAALRRFLDDPEAFEAQLRPRVADSAVERARRHVKRGELARALIQVGRATAYVPGHHGAAAVVRSVTVRRRWARSAVGLAVAATLVGTAYLGLTIRTRWAAAPKQPSPVPSIAPPSATREQMAPPSPVAAAPSPTAGPPVAAARTRPHPTRVRRPSPKPVVAEETPAPEPPPAVVPAVADDATPAPAVSPPAPVPGVVKLMSSRGFCFPSLDDQPVSGQSLAIYSKVAPGRHRVYCDKQLVGEIDVAPGARVEKNIKRGDDGKPRF
jgi:eukaryotic-like serine/threonine-protein kinase